MADENNVAVAGAEGAAQDATDLVAKLCAFHHAAQASEEKADMRFMGLDLVAGKVSLLPLPLPACPPAHLLPEAVMSNANNFRLVFLSRASPPAMMTNSAFCLTPSAPPSLSLATALLTGPRVEGMTLRSAGLRRQPRPWR